MMKVSIIIPCYNQGDLVMETIHSAIVQTYKNIEIIVVNDGSDDQTTPFVLDQIESKLVKVLHTTNQGLAAARNNGIEVAEGDYVLPLDADDLIAPDYVERAITIFEEKKDVGIVYCRAKLFGAVDTEWQLPSYSIEEMLLDNVIFCSAMFRKSDWVKADGYDIGMIYGWEDYEFWLSLIELGCGVYQIPKILFYYRVASNSMIRSKEKWQKVAMFRRIFERHQKLFTDNIEVWINSLLDVRDKYYSSKLYIDTGEGINADEYIVRKVDKGSSEIVFSLNEYEVIENIRFDPVDSPVVVEIMKVLLISKEGDSREFTDYTSNCNFELNGDSFFVTNDPQYFFNISKQELHSTESIIIHLSFKAIGADALMQIASVQQKKLQKLSVQLSDMKTYGVIKAFANALIPHKDEKILDYFKRQLNPF